MSESFRSLFAADQAGTHRSTAGEHGRVDPNLTAADLDAITRDGYVIIENVLDAAQLEGIRAGVAPLLTHLGRNGFEGKQTKRVYSVLAKTNSCNSLVEHDRIQCILDELLLPNYLLSMFQVIDIQPGERSQILHHDDAFYPIARPRPAVSVATIWAIDDFTEENGATDIIAGSHRWGDDRRPAEDEPRVPVVMPAGSVVVLLGTLWHGGGANRSDRSRLAVTCQYCEPWARTQENMSLAVPADVVRTASPSIQRMLGYSIHTPFMGNVNGMSPLRLLD